MKEFNTDKFEHGFIDVYEPYFNDMSDSKHILEIGVYHGESLKYLSNKFKDAKIYGIDIEDKTQYDNEKIKTYIVNQEDRDSLNKFLEQTNVEFDVIIDDGGHTMKQQQISFGTLFKRLKKGGIYILEDLHTSRFENFGTIFPDDLITTLDMLQSFHYTKNIVSNHILDDEKNYLKNNVESVRIWTKTPEYNQSVTSIIKKIKPSITSQTKSLNLIWQTFNGDQTNFEFEYTIEVLFKNLEHNKIFDDGKLLTVLDNSVIIYSNNSNGISEEFNNYLDKFVELGYTFYLLHFSNENLNHNCNYYSKAKHVFRNYYDSNITEQNVTFIPLGVKSGFINKSNNINPTPKEYEFSFIGQPKSDRQELLSVIEQMEKVFIHKTNSWDCLTSLTQNECISIYGKTKFVPCPMGWFHPDSFRLMECLESGSIPILKNYNNLEYFTKIWGDSPIPVVNSWDEIVKYHNMGDNQYNELYNNVFNWYSTFKSNLTSKIKNKLN
jgi:hypothetical protein